MKTKQVIVITSRKAKDDVQKARSFMEEMKNNMIQHANNMARERADKQSKADEQKRFNETNKSKMFLEQLKKTL